MSRLLPLLLIALLSACSCESEPSAPPRDTPDAGDLPDAGEEPDPSPTPTPTPTPEPTPKLILQFSDELPPGVRTRVEEHLRAVDSRDVVVLAPHSLPVEPVPGSLVLAFGATAAARVLITEQESAALESEGYILESGELSGVPLVAVDGRAMDPDPFGHGNLGLAFGAYALLEELGFAFLHPLAPVRPEALQVPSTPLRRIEAPRWAIRGFQLHTMHPLELTDLLNGWSEKGPQDEQGWAAMLPEWGSFLEWMLANGQNRVHWLFLEADSWGDFARSETRRVRIKRLADMAHSYGIAVGVDAPIALQQQHAFRLLREQGELDAELAQIREAVDWLMSAGLDYLATENGTSEFTHPTPDRMLAWMNELARHLDEAHGGKRALMKIHCTMGQFADGYTDLRDDGPLNFNFLTMHADPRLGVTPHTVQHYGLDDPAPTYGNTDFGYIYDYLRFEAGRRPSVWHPETAYWVSFDVDVPLFLPLYAERRIHDLRIIGRDEEAGRLGWAQDAGSRMDGQILFSSGWEWGYWLNDVVAARAAWQPHLDAASDDEAFRRILARVLRPFGSAADELISILSDTVKKQQALLIEGRVGGKAPPTVVKRNGQAYLQGWEAWDDVGELAQSFTPLKPTQPSKLGLLEAANPLSNPRYSDVEPLLSEMATTFDLLARRLESMEPRVPARVRDLWADMADAARMTALRAEQVHGLYDYAAGGLWPQAKHRARLATARRALDDAMQLVRLRELHYRVPADRIAAWRENPTAYEFTYLWTVRSLMYWWRDEAKVIERPLSPCFMNYINPVDIALGEGVAVDLSRLARDLLGRVPVVGSVGECVAETYAEPVTPIPGLR